MAVVSTQQSVAALYAAIFNRAPDQDGLNFWTAKINDGNSFANIATGFAQHEVFTTGIGALPNADYVDALYHNILGAAGDAAGVAYWTARLDGGESKASVVASFVEGSLTIDLDAMLADGSLSQADYDLALVRQQTLTNKADVGIYYAETLGAASNLNPGTDSTSKIALEADPQYKASQAAIANVDSTPASVNSAKEAITVAASTDPSTAPSTDPSQAPLTTFTLTEALANSNLPHKYTLTDAKIDFGATPLDAATATADLAAAQAIVGGASNKVTDSLTLDATYTLSDSLANIQAADAAVVTGAGSYSLTDANVDLGPLAVADVAAAQDIAQAIVAGASNAADLTLAATYSLNDTLANIANPANAATVTGHTYSLTDAALTAADVKDVTVAGLATAQADAIAAVHADAIVAGATNSADIQVNNGTYTLADTLANIQAADDALVTGAGSYSLTDANVDLGPLAVADVAAAQDIAQAIVAGASNAADLTLAATYSLNDTLANIANPANAATVTGHTYSLTDAALTAADVKDVTVAGLATAQADAIAAVHADAIVAGATNGADIQVNNGTYTLADTLANIQAADDALVTGAGSYSLTDANVDLGPLAVADVAAAQDIAQAIVAGASNAADLTLAATYSLNDTLANIANPANAATVTGHTYSLTDAALTAADVKDVTVAGLATAQADAIAAVHADAIVAGATNGADIQVNNGTYTLADTLANIQAADDALVTGAGSYSLTDANVDLGPLAVADVAAAQDIAQAIVAGASNAADLTLAATYSLNDTLANIETDVTVKAGATSLTVDFSDDTTGVTFAASSGNDTIKAGNGANVLTGGAGNDSFVLAHSSVANVSSITDLNLGTNAGDGAIDSLTFSTAAPATPVNIVTLASDDQNTVTSAATLVDAVNLVLAVASNANDVAQFTYGTDTYIVTNGVTDVPASAIYDATNDNLVKITGVAGTLDASDIHFVA